MVGLLYAFSICTAQTLYSGILETGSRAALVSLLAEASAKWNGIKMVPGAALWEMWALATISPRRVRTLTWSPEAMAYLAASSADNSTRHSGAFSCKPAARRLMVPEWY